MKFSLDISEAKSYVAEILGPHKTYKLERTFLDPVKTTRKKHHYNLGDGVFEASEAGDRRYFVVRNGRSYPMHECDLFDSLKLGKKYGLTFGEIRAKHGTMKTTATILDAANTIIEEKGLREREQRIQQRVKEQRKEQRKRRRTKAATSQCRDIFNGSDAAVTRLYLGALEKKKPWGPIAAALFRAQKSSTRAEDYRGNSVDQAYDRKADVIKRLCLLLPELETDLGIGWGWGEDALESYAPHVLYIDLPNGQVSFHSTKRFEGPEYPGEWDGKHASKGRILALCDAIMQNRQCPVCGGVPPEGRVYCDSECFKMRCCERANRKT